MTRSITKHYCDDCNSSHDTLEGAERCESQGRPANKPIGMIFGDNRPNAFHSQIILAIAGPDTHDWHGYGPPTWAARDMEGVGDSFGDERCGGGDLGEMDKEQAHIDFNMPAFGRMVDYLTSEGIEITIWDGERAVPIAEMDLA